MDAMLPKVSHGRSGRAEPWAARRFTRTVRNTGLSLLLLCTGASCLAQEMSLISGAGRDNNELRVEIVQPRDDATIHNNNGDIPVKVEFDQPEAADDITIELLLDGRTAAQQERGEFVLPGVDRGTHRLQARIVDIDGNVLAESDSVTFHVWQASRLFPSAQ